MSTLLESILKNVKITNEILGTAAAPPDASYTVKGISKKYTTAQQLQDSIDNSEDLDFVVSGQAIASVVNQVASATEQLTELQKANLTSFNADNASQADKLITADFFDNSYIVQQGYTNGFYGDGNLAYTGIAGYSSTLYCNDDMYAPSTNAIQLKSAHYVGSGKTVWEHQHPFTTGQPVVAIFSGFAINNPHNFINITTAGHKIIFNNCKIVGGGISCTSGSSTIIYNNCEIIGDSINNDGWDTENPPTSDKLINFTTSSGSKVIFNNCDITLNTLGNIGTAGEMSVYNSRITCAYLFDHSNSHNAYYKFYNSKILCKSEKLAWSSIGYTGAFITNTIRVIISGCDIYADSIREFGADDNTLSSYFYSNSATSKLQVLNSTFRLSTPSGVGSYNLVKAYTGSTIGKVGFVGCVTSTDKDAGVTLSFGTLIVSADLI